jgi:enamine deaminase RidA (YjgF/YER057c/UK114 family)
MKFIDVDSNFPICSAVVYKGKIFEAVVTGIPDGSNSPVPGGAAAEMREIFKQLDSLLAQVGLNKNHICSARLYLQHVNRDIGEVNEVYKEYFGKHTPNRRGYGVDLQAGMLVEAAFVAEFPE